MIIKSFSNKQLADMYGISYDAWLDWIKPIKEKLGRKIRGVWNTNQVEIMVNHFGPPSKELPE